MKSEIKSTKAVCIPKENRNGSFIPFCAGNCSLWSWMQNQRTASVCYTDKSLPFDLIKHLLSLFFFTFCFKTFPFGSILPTIWFNLSCNGKYSWNHWLLSQSYIYCLLQAYFFAWSNKYLVQINTSFALHGFNFKVSVASYALDRWSIMRRKALSRKAYIKVIQIEIYVDHSTRWMVIWRWSLVPASI